MAFMFFQSHNFRGDSSNLPMAFINAVTVVNFLMLAPSLALALWNILFTTAVVPYKTTRPTAW